MSSNTAVIKKSKLSNNKKRKLNQLFHSAQADLLAGKLTMAEQKAQEMLGVDDEYPLAYLVMGMIAEQVGDFKSAKVLLLRGHELAPNNVDLLNFLGHLCLKMEDPVAAIGFFQKYNELEKNNVNVWQSMTAAWSKLEAWGKAEAAGERALALNPKSGLLYKNLGLAKLKQRKHKDAEALLRKAVEILPTDAENWGLLAQTLLEIGELDESMSCFRRSLDINPRLAQSYHMILRFTKADVYSDLMKEAEKLYQDKNISWEERAFLAFGLGKAWEDLGDYDRSFVFYAEGNHLRRTNMEYDINDDKHDLEELKQVFTAEFFAERCENRSGGEDLLFIVGMPRSGSTLLEKILSSHASVVDTGEQDALRNVVSVLGNDQSRRISLTQLVQATDEELEMAAKTYMRIVHMNFPTGEKYTDKSLPNLWLIGAIRLIFPKAKILHCSRNYLDNCFSIYSNDFAGYLFKYGYDLQELGQYYRLYLEMMEHWRQVLPSDVFYDASYDALVMNPEMEARKVVEFCGLEWDEACLQFYKKKSAVQTSSLAQVRQPIYKTSVERWRKYEKHLQPLVEALGDAV